MSFQTPKEVFHSVVDSGKLKVQTNTGKLLLQAFFAGAYIAFGGFLAIKIGGGIPEIKSIRIKPFLFIFSRNKSGKIIFEQKIKFPNKLYFKIFKNSRRTPIFSCILKKIIKMHKSRTPPYRGPFCRLGYPRPSPQPNVRELGLEPPGVGSDQDTRPPAPGVRAPGLGEVTSDDEAGRGEDRQVLP